MPSLAHSSIFENRNTLSRTLLPPSLPLTMSAVDQPKVALITGVTGQDG